MWGVYLAARATQPTARGASGSAGGLTAGDGFACGITPSRTAACWGAGAAVPEAPATPLAAISADGGSVCGIRAATSEAHAAVGRGPRRFLLHQLEREMLRTGGRTRATVGGGRPGVGSTKV